MALLRRWHGLSSGDTLVSKGFIKSIKATEKSKAHLNTSAHMRSWDSLRCRSSNNDVDAPLSTHRRDGRRKARHDIDGQQNAHIAVDGRQKACNYIDGQHKACNDLNGRQKARNYIDGQLKACNDLNGRQKARNDLDGQQNAHIDVDGRQKACYYREDEKRRIQFISNAKQRALD